MYLIWTINKKVYVLYYRIERNRPISVFLSKFQNLNFYCIPNSLTLVYPLILIVMPCKSKSKKRIRGFFTIDIKPKTSASTKL